MPRTAARRSFALLLTLRLERLSGFALCLPLRHIKTCRSSPCRLAVSYHLASIRSLAALLRVGCSPLLPDFSIIRTSCASASLDNRSLSQSQLCLDSLPSAEVFEGLPTGWNFTPQIGFLVASSARPPGAVLHLWPHAHLVAASSDCVLVHSFGSTVRSLSS